MDEGKFYFLKDEYFSDFDDKNLMKNREIFDGKLHGRPCFYSFRDSIHNIYWMIPISSQVKKYKEIHRKNILKYKTSYTLMFGNVLGREKAFLLQNIFPVIEYYVDSEYVDSYKSFVDIDPKFRAELIYNAKEIIKLVRKGKKLIFPDILKIEKELISMLKTGVK